MCISPDSSLKPELMAALPPGTLSLIAPLSKQRAAQGVYVHLEEFLPTGPRPTTDEDLTRIYLNSKGEFTNLSPTTFYINRLEKWLEAWNSFERVLMCQDVSLYHGLASYRDFILKCNKKFVWSAVYAYDRRYRAHLADQHSMDYGTINQALYSEVFDNDAVRQDLIHCYRCRSTDHSVRRCPFPRTKQRRRKKRGRHAVSFHTVSADLSTCLHTQDIREDSSRSSPLPSVVKQQSPSSVSSQDHQILPTTTSSPVASSGASSFHHDQTTPSSDQPAVTLQPAPVRRLNPEAFKRGLESHPDRQFVD